MKTTKDKAGMNKTKGGFKQKDLKRETKRRDGKTNLNAAKRLDAILADNPTCEPAPICHLCGEIGHKHQINEVEPFNPDYFSGGRSYVMSCKNRPINPNVYRIVE